MKPISIPSRKILLICIILLCGVAAVIGGLCLSRESRKTEGSFFEIAGFSVDDVDKVSICYQGTVADLPSEDQLRLLDSLSSTIGQALTFNHEYPYRISDYKIQFHVNGNMIEYPFAWFMGKDGVVFIDRRVDIQIENNWFTFQQTGETFWNDTVSQITFESAAEESGLTWYKEEKGSGILCYGGAVVEPDYSDPLLYIEDAQLVVLATRVATEYRFWNGQFADPMEIMKVQEVIKGQWDPNQFLEVRNLQDKRLEVKNETARVKFSTLHWLADNPDGYTFIEDGKVYLLCLTYDEYNDAYYSKYSFAHCLASVIDDTAYACVNHENHPFLARPMDEIRAMCKK